MDCPALINNTVEQSHLFHNGELFYKLFQIKRRPAKLYSREGKRGQYYQAPYIPVGLCGSSGVGAEAPIHVKLRFIVL
jgi:hypothetical protein